MRITLPMIATTALRAESAVGWPEASGMGESLHGKAGQTSKGFFF
jgi:hypothetical protein